MSFRVLRAISDASRWKLLSLLSTAERCVCELPLELGISQPAVSQHLNVLKKTGLVLMRRSGTKRMYVLSKLGERVLKDVQGWSN